MGEEQVKSNSEARFTKARPDCPHPEYWTSEDGDATENEVVEMVAGLVRGIQPDTVLETGTHTGVMAAAIGEALQKNGHGHLVSYEPDLARVSKADKRIRRQGVHVQDFVTVVCQPSMQPWTYGAIDFAWFDSLLDLRLAEFEYYLPHMHANTIVGFHDAGPHHGKWSDPVRTHSRLRAFDMPTPRGMLLGRVIL